MNSLMRKLVWLVALLVVAACGSDEAPRGIETVLQQEPDIFFEQAVVGPQDDGTWVVATTQRIDPAGDSVVFPGRPTDLALSPDGALLAVKNMEDLVFVDAGTHEIVQTLSLPDGGNSFAGITFDDDGERVWTTDTEGFLRSAARDEDGRFDWFDAIQMPSPAAGDDSGPYPGGFVFDRTTGLAYVALSRNNTLAVVNLEAGSVETEIEVGISPYMVVLVDDKAYVSNWGGRRPGPEDFTALSSGSEVVVDPDTGIAASGTVSIIDLARRETIGEIEVGLHPSGLATSPDGTRLYVANANSDSVSVIDTVTDRVIGILDPKPMPELPFGSAPNALAVSPDGQTLFVANGGNNAIAVIDLVEFMSPTPREWAGGTSVARRDSTPTTTSVRSRSSTCRTRIFSSSTPFAPRPTCNCHASTRR